MVVLEKVAQQVLAFLDNPKAYFSLLFHCCCAIQVDSYDMFVVLA